MLGGPVYDLFSIQPYITSWSEGRDALKSRMAKNTHLVFDKGILYCGLRVYELCHLFVVKINCTYMGL